MSTPPVGGSGNGYSRVLAVETSTALGGLALLEGDQVRAKTVFRTDGAHSRRLLPLLNALLVGEELRVQELDLLVACLGPGSFTGLRIGLATVKGLALASGVPVAGASSLAALAHAASAREGLVAPALDARKGDVYAALYRVEQGSCRTLLPETVEPPERWAGRVAEAAAGEPVLWLGTGARQYQELLLRPAAAGSRLLGPEFDAPDPAHLALLGRQQALAHGPAELAALEPHYLRASDVELGLGKKKAGQ